MSDPVFDEICHDLAVNFHEGVYHSMPPSRVHAQDVSDDKRFSTCEQLNVNFTVHAGFNRPDAKRIFSPNLPWAEDHFQERISGKPLNPPPSAKRWPFTQAGHEEHLEDGKFSHTYPERFWPRNAGEHRAWQPGIRYQWGDLYHMTTALVQNHHTRQAYLPIFFPEDTGQEVRDKVRVPCTLGYHFQVRGGYLHVTYLMRSCDFMRYFRDDLYMAARLGQYVYSILAGANIELPYGVQLHVHIMNLHIFEGDLPILRMKYELD